MKFSKFIILFIFIFNNSNAQYVTIPDANFVSWLNNNGFSNCMSGNQLDTTCNDVLNESFIDCSGGNINDLTGICFFKNLLSLSCHDNHISILPPLPSSLVFLDCSVNQLTDMPELPVSIIALYCDLNQLTSLPALPPLLTVLDCGENPLGSLPSLPPSLINLGCWLNQLDSLPPLPPSLINLKCYENNLTSLPELPITLSNLNCSWNPLSSLPDLPASLINLSCNNNQLTTLHDLPVSLSTLDCSGNELISLPLLPDDLTFLFCYGNLLDTLPALPLYLYMLDCSNNHLTTLPFLPASLQYLYCHSNQLTSLPSLPDELTLLFLDCSYNQLLSLPALPVSLSLLNCSRNYLTFLPEIPGSLSTLDCSFNQITFLPPLPYIMSALYINDNPGINCLPVIDSISYDFQWGNTNITCLAKIIKLASADPPITGIPLCAVPAKPKSIGVSGGIAKVCPGDSRFYSTAFTAGGSYLWTVPNGVVINSGQGSRTINVTFNSSFPANGLISVKKVAGCSSSLPISLRVFRNTPLIPSVIMGPSSGLCGATGKSYSVTNSTGLTYFWTVPAGAVITNGQGSNNIIVDFPSVNFTGMISVKGVNTCGAGAMRNLSMRAIPATPSVISGPATICASQQNAEYNIADVTGATSYSWLVPASANIISGQGTNTIIVNFGNAGGTVRVRSLNGCGSSSYKSLAVIVNCRLSFETNNDLEASINPNPSGDHFTLHVSEANESNGELVLSNMLGEELLHKTNLKPGDDFSFGEDLSSGIYIAMLIQGQERKILKLVKRMN